MRTRGICPECVEAIYFEIRKVIIANSLLKE